MSKFTPEFKGPIEGWVVNQLEREYWRVQSTMTRMDVMQEAYIVFDRVRRTYEGKIKEPKHFMSLFKTSWTRHFTDLSVTDSECRTASVAESYADSAGELENEGYLRTLVRQAPAEVRLVLTMFLNAPQELVDLATSSFQRVGRGGQRAADNRRVASLLGLPEGSTPLDAVEGYLSDTLH